MPVGYPDSPRFHLSLRQAIAIAVVIVALAAVFLFRDVYQSSGQLTEASARAAHGQTAVELPGTSTSAGHEPGAASSGTAVEGTNSTTIVVSVVGHVEHSGLVTLPRGARVNDALTQAAPLPDAQLVALNLAQVLNDGEQIVVPGPGEEPLPTSSPTEGGGKVSLNRADTAALTQLPGVGAKTAAAIVEYRDSIGGFTSVEQLMDVKGIGPAKFEALRAEVQL